MIKRKNKFENQDFQTADRCSTTGIARDMQGDKDNNKNSEKKKEKGFAIVSIGIFMIILTLPTLLWLCGNLVNQKAFGQLDYNLGENRNKAPFPEGFNKNFPDEMEAYYNDRVPFRSVIISAGRKLTSLMEKPYDNAIGPYLAKAIGLPVETAGERMQDGALQSANNDYLLPRFHNDTVVEGREQWLFYVEENSLEDYLGSNVLSLQEMQDYLNHMEKLQEICEKQGKELYFLIPPNKEQVYPEMMPSFQIVDSYKKVQRLVDYIHENSDVRIIYPLEELMAAKEKWQLYYKRDTHWNVAGAFIATQALYEIMGMPLSDLEDLSITEEEVDFDEDLTRMGNLSKEDFDKDVKYNIFYRLYVETVVEEGERVDSDVYITSSTAENQDRIALVGDSFRTYMTQYLTRDFGSCSMIHWLHMDEEQSVKAVKNADILIIELVERNNPNLPELIDSVCRHLQ